MGAAARSNGGSNIFSPLSRAEGAIFGELFDLLPFGRLAGTRNVFGANTTFQHSKARWLAGILLQHRSSKGSAGSPGLTRSTATFLDVKPNHIFACNDVSLTRIPFVPIQIRCRKCDSDVVTRDAWAAWEVDSQVWVLGAVFDNAFCHTCEAETQLAELELTIRPGESHK